jgi:hypothetical protein
MLVDRGDSVGSIRLSFVVPLEARAAEVGLAVGAMVGGVCGVFFVAHGHQSTARGLVCFTVVLLSGKIVVVDYVCTSERELLGFHESEATMTDGRETRWRRMGFCQARSKLVRKEKRGRWGG